MKLTICLTCLAAFFWLAGYSYPQPIGYTPAQIAAVNRLVASTQRHKGKMTAQQQAQAIVYLFGKE